jgi:hypothetical protein
VKAIAWATRLDVWYLVPVGALAAGTNLRLYPDDGCKAARFEKYRERWELFRGEGAEAKGKGRSAAGSEELCPGDEAVPESVARFRVLSSGGRGFLGVKGGMNFLQPCLSKERRDEDRAPFQDESCLPLSMLLQ